MADQLKNHLHDLCKSDKEMNRKQLCLKNEICIHKSIEEQFVQIVRFLKDLYLVISLDCTEAERKKTDTQSFGILKFDLGKWLEVFFDDIEIIGSAWGVMVIVVGNGHGDTSSNPGRD